MGFQRHKISDTLHESVPHFHGKDFCKPFLRFRSEGMTHIDLRHNNDHSHSVSDSSPYISFINPHCIPEAYLHKFPTISVIPASVNEMCESGFFLLSPFPHLHLESSPPLLRKSSIWFTFASHHIAYAGL